ncbi:hypothetical protein H0G86_009434 [Trichoderma simmonsii]|uniref:Uncharacterized protein n=1 Tax=Trichoderma simmonsii TaxID=1491479 RepID=A0A8G0LKC4_9HYPO|nr:hypothetical protein H0G86_009434 [Trichoderma simmonsii]
MPFEKTKAPGLLLQAHHSSAKASYHSLNTWAVPLPALPLPILFIKTYIPYTEYKYAQAPHKCFRRHSDKTASRIEALKTPESARPVPYILLGILLGLPSKGTVDRTSSYSYVVTIMFVFLKPF